ncbi:MAG: OmpA family protein [Prochloron sp. SP5CPC1]|nr:OmpA family protein [Candidatus Paraprochloron terpiosi SP5CPC1]
MLKIIGHTDPSGGEEENQQLAQARGSTVKQYLVAQGIAGERLVVVGIRESPPNAKENQPLWLSRCVRFERILPGIKKK